MKKAIVKIHNKEAGYLRKEDGESRYTFQYKDDYDGDPVSLTMEVREPAYEYKTFPPFFDGLLPEGTQLDGLLKKYKIDQNDYFEQLIKTGSDLVGAVTVEKANSENE